MPTLIVTNTGVSTVSVGAAVGSVPGRSTRTVELTVAELEGARDTLVSLAVAGAITWAVSQNVDSADDEAEFLSAADSGTKNTSRIDIYVATTGSDANDGLSPRKPLKSLNAAFAKIPDIIAASVVVHIASGAYVWDTTLGPKQLYQPIVLYGDGAGQINDDGFTELQATAAAAAGTGQRVVVDPTGGLTVNAYQGKTIQILDGAAAGDRRTIRNNTTTDFVPVSRFSAAVAPGDSFRVVEPAIVIEYDGTRAGVIAGEILVNGCGSPVASTVFGNAEMTAENKSSLMLANLALQPTDGSGAGATFRVGSSALFLAGVEFPDKLAQRFNADRNTYVAAGTDRGNGNPNFWLPEALGLASGDRSWAGWGVAQFTGGFSPLDFMGFVVAKAPTVTLTGRLLIRGGAIVSTSAGVDSNGFVHVTGNGADVTFEGTESALPILLSCVGAAASSFLLSSDRGSMVYMSSVEAEITGDGVGLIASHPHGFRHPSAGVISLGPSVSISAPRVAAGATAGGKLYYDDAPTLPVAPSVSEIAVWVGDIGAAPVVGSQGTFAGLADGQVLLSPVPGDGSVVMRVT